MSLVFENAIGEFNIAIANFFELADSRSLNVEEERERIPLESITEYALHHERLQHPERDDWTCIPLHETNNAQLTDQYVVYTNHSVRGEIFIYQSEGEQETITIDDAARSFLADRLRFWHSDYVPETNPPYYKSPIQANELARNPITDKSADTFFDDLLSFIENERSAQRETNLTKALQQSPEAIYHDGGDAIPSLRSLGKASEGVYRLLVDYDAGSSSGGSSKSVTVSRKYGVYEQNEVLLFPPESADAPDSFPIRATITDLTGSNLYIDINWNGVDRRSRVQRFLEGDQSGYGVVSLLNSVPYDREVEGVKDVRSTERFRQLLVGNRDLTFSDSAAALSETHDEKLNQEQQIAVKHALLADDLFCIHGPPGTGKTRTLVETIRRTVEAGQSVLVCADSNQAVDNLVVGSSRAGESDERSLHAYAQHGSDEFTMTRANGHRSRNELVREKYSTKNTDKAEVVAATNSSAASLDRQFDVAIVDEATQATCTATCIPLSRAGKLVLAGDHKQLPPFSSSETPPESAFGMSLFEHLYASGGIYEGVGIQLRTQYRMHEKISYYPNRRFYDRVLRNGRTIESLEHHPAVLGYDIGGNEVRRDTSLANPTEARLIVHLITNLVSDEPTLSPSDIGVISPYRAQTREIQTQIREHTNFDSAPLVDTVDAFQGGEKPVILISLVRSNPEGNIGFMGRPADGPRRLNVALTRSQRFCAVIGNWDTLRASTENKKCVDLYRDFHSHLEDTGHLQHVEPELIPL